MHPVKWNHAASPNWPGEERPPTRIHTDMHTPNGILGRQEPAFVSTLWATRICLTISPIILVRPGGIGHKGKKTSPQLSAAAPHSLQAQTHAPPYLLDLLNDSFLFRLCQQASRPAKGNGELDRLE